MKSLNNLFLFLLIHDYKLVVKMQWKIKTKVYTSAFLILHHKLIVKLQFIKEFVLTVNEQVYLKASRSIGIWIVRMSEFELSEFELSELELSEFELSEFELSEFELSEFELSCTDATDP